MNWVVYKKVQVVGSDGYTQHKAQLLCIFDGDMNGQQAAMIVAYKLNNRLPEGSLSKYNALRANDKLINEMFVMEKVNA